MNESSKISDLTTKSTTKKRVFTIMYTFLRTKVLFVTVKIQLIVSSVH